MRAPGTYQTETSDMFAVHQALLEALDAAPALIRRAGDTPDRVELIGSYYENVLEFLHVHHAGEDELIYPILEERCTDDKAMLERVDAQHRLLDEPMDKARDAITAWRAHLRQSGARRWWTSSESSARPSGPTWERRRR